MKKFAFLVFGLSLLLAISCQKSTIDSNDDLSKIEQENIAAINSVLQDSTELSYDALDDANEDNIDAEA